LKQKQGELKMSRGEKQSNLLESKVGKVINVNGWDFVVLKRKNHQPNKPDYYLLCKDKKRAQRYGSSLYSLTSDFVFFDLIEDGQKRFYLWDLNFDTTIFEIKAKNSKEARKKALEIAKTFTIRGTSQDFEQVE
jgi:hypothetical protein